MTFFIHMANIVSRDKPVESNDEAEEIRNDPTSSPHSRAFQMSLPDEYPAGIFSIFFIILHEVIVQSFHDPST